MRERRPQFNKRLHRTADTAAVIFFHTESGKRALIRIPADGVIRREARAQYFPVAPLPVRRPKNLPDGRTIPSAALGSARGPPPGPEKDSSVGATALEREDGSARRLPQNDSSLHDAAFLRIRYDTKDPSRGGGSFVFRQKDHLTRTRQAESVRVL